MSEPFVKMQKGDEMIEVSPLVVADHQRLGWIIVVPAPVEEAPAVSAETPEPVAEAPKPSSKKKASK